MKEETKIAVNSIYSTYQGEVNHRGIGAPVIFLRLQGCHIRCYEKTLGTLCDTPEALERDDSMGITTLEILQRIEDIRNKTGIDYICLSGGDPLWRKPELLRELLYMLQVNEFHVSVETSGTISMQPFSSVPNVTWVLDYKLRSAGIKLPFMYKDLPLLSQDDFIKFVVYDDADYEEMRQIVPQIRMGNEKVKLAVGAYWGGKLTNSEIFARLQNDKLTKDVVLNVQLHKMVTFCDFNKEELTKVFIPPLI